MKNVNINLTQKQAELVDQNAKRFGFANRSEFMRALLRYAFYHSPNFLKDMDSFVFEKPTITEPDKIAQELKKSGKYSPEFIESVRAGLKKSKHLKQK